MDDQFVEKSDRPTTHNAWAWIFMSAIVSSALYLGASDPLDIAKSQIPSTRLAGQMLHPIANRLGTKGSLFLGIIFVSIGVVMLRRAKVQQLAFDKQCEREQRLERRRQEKSGKS